MYTEGVIDHYGPQNDPLFSQNNYNHTKGGLWDISVIPLHPS